MKNLDLIPDNVVVLNNYSYYLSLREDLEKAERMSKQCVELNQTNLLTKTPWQVLYKLKRFNEAEEWLKSC